MSEESTPPTTDRVKSLEWKPVGNPGADKECHAEGYYLSVTEYKSGWMPVCGIGESHEFEHILDYILRDEYVSTELEAKSIATIAMLQHRLSLATQPDNHIEQCKKSDNEILIYSQGIEAGRSEREKEIVGVIEKELSPLVDILDRSALSADPTREDHCIKDIKRQTETLLAALERLIKQITEKV